MHVPLNPGYFLHFKEEKTPDKEILWNIFKHFDLYIFFKQTAVCNTQLAEDASPGWPI